MLDVLVCCLAHEGHPWLSLYPQVRGFYLAKHLARAGVNAAFESFPCKTTRCRVLICSEYQGDGEWLAYLEPHLTAVDADRRYCLTAFGLGGRQHFSRPMTEWFAARGGVLCLREGRAMERYERHVGIGVDTEVVRFSAEVERRTVLFDFPLSRSGARWNEHFSIAGLERARRACPRARFVGSGEANSPARPYFDDWIPYGAPHPQYVKAFEGCAAFVPGHHESVGLALCEAQVAGAAVVYRRGFVHADVLCSGAGFPYDDDDELVVALDQALAGEGTVIAADAARRFDYSRVVERVRAATGV